MRSPFILWILAGSLGCSLASTPVPTPNIEPLMPNEVSLWHSLDEMQWKEELSKTEEKAAIEALRSTNATIIELAVRVVVLHRLREALASVRAASHPVDRWLEQLATVVVHAFEAKGDPIAALHAPALHNESERVRKTLTAIIVINEAKALRAGKKKPSIPGGLCLNMFQSLLLRYSAMPREQVFKEIFQRLAKIKTITPEENDLARVLRSYGYEVCVPALIQHLSNRTTVKGISRYGKLVLLDLPLMSFLHRMTATDITGVQTVLARLSEGEDRKFLALMDDCSKRLAGRKTQLKAQQSEE